MTSMVLSFRNQAVLEVSWVIGAPPVIILSNGIFPYKPSITRRPPLQDCSTCCLIRDPRLAQGAWSHLQGEKLIPIVISIQNH